MDRLVPLPRIARRLGVKPSLLVRLAASGEFVPVIEITRGVYRVDEQAATVWIASRDVRALASRRHAPSAPGAWLCP